MLVTKFGDFQRVHRKATTLLQGSTEIGDKSSTVSPLTPKLFLLS